MTCRNWPFILGALAVSCFLCSRVSSAQTDEYSLKYRMTHFGGTLPKKNASVLPLSGERDTNWSRNFELFGPNAAVLSLAEDDTKPRVYVGGSFTRVGVLSANHIAAWDGVSWSALGSGINWTVRAMVYGNGRLYAAGGDYLDHKTHSVEVWDGSQWTSIGALNSTGWIEALLLDRTGNLYAGGYFDSIGGIAADNVAMWDGAQWHAMAGGVSNDGGVTAFALGDNQDVYVGGDFTKAGGQTVNFIARWDAGTNTWNSVAGGLNFYVNALAYDGLRGILYAGSAHPVTSGAPYLAETGGGVWTTVGGDVGSFVDALLVGGLTGDSLYVGGEFTSAGGNASIRYLTTWNGQMYEAFGHGTNDIVSALAGGDPVSDFDPFLYVGGYFTTAGGYTAPNFSSWDLGNADLLGYVPSSFGFSYINTMANMWPATWTNTIDYSNPKYKGLLAICNLLHKPVQQTDFPDWDLYADAFGPSAVYDAINPQFVYNPKAVRYWCDIRKAWGGSCYGFALASLLYFNDDTEFPVGYLLRVTDSSRFRVNKYYLDELGKETLPYNTNLTANYHISRIIDSLRHSLEQYPLNLHTLFLEGYDPAGTKVVWAHAVSPYRVLCVMDTTGDKFVPHPTSPQIIDSVFVYDPNFGAKDSIAIRVNPVLNYWIFSTEGQAEKNKGFYLFTPVSRYAHGARPVLNDRAKPGPTGKPGTLPLSSDTDAISIYFGDDLQAGTGAVLLQSDDGRWLSTEDTGLYPGAQSVIPQTGGKSHVIGWTLPEGDFPNMVLGVNPEAAPKTEYVDVDDAELSIHSHFQQADTTVPLTFQIDKSLQSFGLRANTHEDSVGTVVIWNEGTAQHALGVIDYEMERSDSLSFRKGTSGSRPLSFTNIGADKIYNLDLIQSSGSLDTEIRFANIPLHSGELQTVNVGRWDSLGNTRIAIEVDRDHDGTVDTTMVLFGQPMESVMAAGSTSTLWLEQNTPNPVRASTEIPFHLSAASHVRLTIYDDLGRAVSTLLDQEYPAGTFRARWNPKGFAAGIYFYRLEANGIILQRALSLAK